MKIKLLIFLLLGCHATAQSQELFCKANVIADQIQGVDGKVFKTLEQGVADFMNKRKWGNDAFDTKEKIECVINIVISKSIEGTEGGFIGRISVQANRPVYNTNYNSPLINFTDKDLAFKYIQFQNLEFSDTRIAGNDPLESNLTAVLAYYAYMILGLDYDSFSPKGGTEFFNKALNIANNAPEHKTIVGWKGSESQRNRFWFIDQILNARFIGFRDVFYKYHRLGLDVLSTNPEEARLSINGLFPVLQQINADNPSTMLMQVFFNTKSDEIQGFMSNASMADKQKLIPILSSLDIANAGKYAELMKP
ncbi:MAG: DUF4835 family protein [Chitinophagaceae bacterium]|nr:DUF4835 family protein [Chitinophagaceae bacterium]